MTPKQTKMQLAIARAAEEFPICYDEDMSGRGASDPLCQVHDMSSDPVTWYREQLDALVEVQKDYLNRGIHAGEPYTRYGNAQHALAASAFRSAARVVRFIGGVNVTKAHRPNAGDDDAEWIIPL